MKQNIWKEVIAANFSDEHTFSCNSMGSFWKKRTNSSQKTLSSIFPLRRRQHVHPKQLDPL